MNARRKNTPGWSARPATIAGLILVLACVATGCASLDVDRTSANSGTFSSSAIAFTILSLDMPEPALSIARGNVADTGLPELIIEHETVFPHFGPFDWVLDIVSIRYARVTGTWGERASESSAANATPRSNQ